MQSLYLLKNREKYAPLCSMQLGMPIPRQFSFLGDSGNGETKTYSPDFGEFRGVVCFRFEVNLKFLLIEKIFLKLFFNSKE